MLEIAKKEIFSQNLQNRVNLKNANFSENPFSEYSPFDTIFLDLGISSFHLDSIERGISIKDHGVLDMRLNPREGIPLWKWLKKTSMVEIRDVIYRFGEESYAPRIAQKIVEDRPNHEELTADWLNRICIASYSGGRHSRYVKNPGIKTFQAFRIFINNEIQHLENALDFLPYLLKIQGKLIIISFHSLEDRVVKHAFRSLEKIENKSDFARSAYREGDFSVLTKKPVLPSQEEVESNPRSRSAKMRVLQRLR